MSSLDEYRTAAADCLRRADENEEPDRPLWITLAQSWLALAEQAAAREIQPPPPPQRPRRRTH